MGIRDSVKPIIVGCAFLGLIAWVAVLQTQHSSLQVEHKEKVSEHEANLEAYALLQAKQEDVLKEHREFFKDQDKRIKTVSRDNARMKRSLNAPQQTGGASYVRWGRSVCPDDAELVYSGFAGGQHYTHVGGASEYICLSSQPKYAKTTSANDATAYIHGVELGLTGTQADLFDTTNAQPNALHDSDVQCAVCRSRSRTSMLMIPGTNECTPGWNREYWGYLMTEHHAHKATHTYACVDHAPEAGNEGGSRNDNGALMYHVQGVCGSLPCKPYVQYYELTCVVCTK